MIIIFRKDKRTKEIIAFFPEVEVNYGHIMSYMHIGQHAEAALDYYYNTVKVNEHEYKDLLEELKNIYNDEELNVKKKLNYSILSKSWIR